MVRNPNGKNAVRLDPIQRNGNNQSLSTYPEDTDTPSKGINTVSYIK